MCNLYSVRRQRSELVRAIGAMIDRNDNQPPGSFWPDYAAPVVVNGAAGREVRDMRWGMPSPRNVLMAAAGKRADELRAKGQVIDEAAFTEIVRVEPDKGVTNARRTESRHWAPWLKPGNRCLVPFTSFSEPDQVGESLKPVWFALSEDEPLAFFAGVWTRHACVRKMKTGWEETDVFGFLTTDRAEPERTYHDKAMPVVLTEPAEWDEWLSGKPWAEVAHLQRPLPDRLVIVPAPTRGASE